MSGDTLVGLAFALEVFDTSDVGVAAASLENPGDFLGVNLTGEVFCGTVFLGETVFPFLGESFFSDIFVN